ncbi:hypothetical protein AB0L65_17660 [Nonomuraea sp. NPDC052116]|uniref:S10 family serine carboxypeptidase-like protein n=1 Tax=Nonomuraea sp. NPDC052116 TaxID=3155665 RepID=UPI0034285972
MPKSYTTRWESSVLAGADGVPDALISGTSYVVPGSGRRPVVFLFNGGPGASSSPLHMSAFGPQRFETVPAETGRRRIVVPNPLSIIDVADLVFVDPVGTGFSRVLREGGAAPYMTVHGDVAAMRHFIRDWLARHDRRDCPSTSSARATAATGWPRSARRSATSTWRGSSSSRRCWTRRRPPPRPATTCRTCSNCPRWRWPPGRTAARRPARRTPRSQGLTRRGHVHARARLAAVGGVVRAAWRRGRLLPLGAGVAIVEVPATEL